MKQTKTKLQNFVKRIRREAYEEGFNAAMNTKQWDKDIAKTIPEKISHKSISELLKEKEK